MARIRGPQDVRKPDPNLTRSTVSTTPHRPARVRGPQDLGDYQAYQNYSEENQGLPEETSIGEGKFSDDLEALALNSLAGYVNTSYHISLSMVRKPRLATPEALESQDRICFASSGQTESTGGVNASAPDFQTTLPGEVGDDLYYNESTGEYESREVLSVSSVFFVNSMNVRTVKGLTRENPELALVVEMKLNLHEPFGLSLDREIRNIASKFGYTGVLSRVVWRVSVHWSGYDESTGEWKAKIPFRNPFTGGVSDSVTYFCNMINFEANVSSVAGTDYTLHLLPVELSATRPEIIKIDAHNWDKGTFGELASAISQTLTDSTKEEVNGVPGAEYEIRLSPDCEHLRDQKIAGSTEEILANSGRSESSDGTIKYVMTARDDSIISIIMTVLSTLEQVQSDFVRPKDVNRVEPRITYVVRPSVDYSNAKYDPQSNDISGLKYVYTIEKFLDWRTYTGSNDITKNQTYVDQRISSALAHGAIRRVYNYAYTPGNTEVINFDIKLSVFYWEEIGSDLLKSTSAQGGFSNSKTPEEQAETRSDYIKENSRREVTSSGESSSESIPHDSGGNNSSGSPSHVSYKNVRTADQKKEQDLTSALTMTYNSQFEKRITNDLITLENLKVVGDPVWLLSRAALGSDSVNGVSEILRINIRRPDQSSYMSPDYDGARNSDLSLGGFYEVVEINHEFDGGVFTQTMNGYRLKNMGIE